MGVTKRPASNCSDELIPVEVEVIDDFIDLTVNSATTSDISADESDYEMYTLPVAVVGSTTYYRSLFSELRTSHDVGNNNAEGIKPAVFKKKNVSLMGRRKANRAQNESYLLSLSGDLQQYPEDEIFFNNNKNGFTKAVSRLCTQPDLKESFIEGNDKFVLQKSNKRSIAEKNNDKTSKRSILPDTAFKNLTTSQKSLFKQKSLPVAAIDHLETEVVGYFNLVPNGVYTSAPLPSYHRMLLHGIVRYYSLDATSVNNRGRRAQKIVQVRNSRFDDFKPPRMTLLQFISNPNRSKSC